MKSTSLHTNSFVQEILDLDSEIIIKGASHEKFVQLAARFPDLRMEQEKNGDISIMAPIAGFGGFRESDFDYSIKRWAKKFKNGKTCSSSTGFILPDGSTKSPDAAWLSNETYAIAKEKYIGKGFLPVVPDFVVEVRSSSDRLPKLKAKMEKTWIANGVRLAWLIDPYREKAYIFRQNGEVEVVVGFHNSLSGEDVLPGLKVDLEDFRLEEKE